MNKKLLNPVFTYIWLWSITVSLINLSITNNLENFSGTAVVLVYATIASALLIGIFDFVISGNSKVSQSINDIEYLKKFGNKLYYFWVVSVIIYGSLTGGYNLIWIFQGVKVDYSESQLASLWGLNITICYILGSIFLYLIVSDGNSNNLKFKFACVLFFPVLIYSRNVLLQLFIQLFVIWFFNSKTGIIKLLAWGFLVSLAGIYLFGFIGDTRMVDGNVNPFSSYVSQEYVERMNQLPTGFTWLYVYITANFNNVIYALNDSHPTFEFYPIFMNLVPGVLRPLFFDGALTTNDVMSAIVKDPSFTVASFFGGPVISFGLTGAIFAGIFIQLFSMFFYKKALSNNFGYLLCYSSIYACMIFSIFYDCFFTVGTFTQLIFGLYLSKYSLKNVK